MSNGRTADALVDFTGGVAEKLVLAEVGLSDTHSQLAFFKKLQEAVENHALVNCNIEVRRVLMFELYTYPDCALYFVRIIKFRMNKVLTIVIQNKTSG